MATARRPTSRANGDHTHAYALGQLARLALMVGTELIFSPVRHPESNGYVERFHHEYNRHVWDDTYLADLAAVRQASDHFFPLYCTSGFHSALNGHTPQEVHSQPVHRPPQDFIPPADRLSLYEECLHCIRQVLSDGTVSVLNVCWPVPNPDPLKDVWVTIELRTFGATPSIYDAAPDVLTRRCLATYPFPLQESVLPRNETAIGRPGSRQSQPPPAETERSPLASALHSDTPITVGTEPLFRSLLSVVHRTRKIAAETMS